MAFSFFGGIHPKENKHFAEALPVQEFPQPAILVVPMQQHIGAPCAPLVKKGDVVDMGQKIGDNQGLCVPVHAPVSGKVKAVEMRPHTSGTMVMSVVIENDFENRLSPQIQKRTAEEVEALTPEALMGIIREVLGEGSFAGMEIPFLADYTIPVLTMAPGGFIIYSIVAAVISKLHKNPALEGKGAACAAAGIACCCNKEEVEQ